MIYRNKGQAMLTQALIILIGIKADQFVDCIRIKSVQNNEKKMFLSLAGSDRGDIFLNDLGQLQASPRFPIFQTQIKTLSTQYSQA